MSTDQYPEVNSDDSGLVPQNAPKAEWPKKIRTLSAVELDRLTIDGDGRFYWDGHLVNYQPPQAAIAAAQTGPSDPVDLDALALLDRAARELSGRPAPEPQAVTEPTQVAPEIHSDAPLEAIHTGEPTVVAVAPLAPVAEVPKIPRMIDMAYRMPIEKVRLRMSFWQSLALLVVVLGLLVGAAGIAVSGLVAAHGWGCRTNLVKQYCPPPPPEPKPPARVDIPA